MISFRRKASALETTSSFGDNSRGNIKNLCGDKGLSNYNQPLNNTTSLVYDLPFGKGRRYLADGNPFVESALGGWRLTLINTMTSGLPVNLTYNMASVFQAGSSLTYRPNLTGQPLIQNPDEPTAYLNPRAVTVPTDRTQPFGNAGRNIVRAPNFFQSDLGLHKSFPLWGESKRLEFRMEAFNLFNRTNFLAPDGNASNISFDAAGDYTGNFGKITSASRRGRFSSR